MAVTFPINCLANMILSVIETVYKTTCIRFMMTDGLTANPQNLQLANVLEFQNMSAQLDFEKKTANRKRRISFADKYTFET